MLGVGEEVVKSGNSTLDGIFCGGLCRGRCHEICGDPGSGKTLLALVLAKHILEQNDTGAVYWIDTTASFPSRRAVKVLQHQTLISRFVYNHALTYEEVLDSVSEIFNIIERGEEVRLVVLDNASIPFRIINTETIAERVELINNFGLQFRRLAVLHDIPIIFTNHLTKRVRYDGRSETIPCLGETWSFIVDVRLLLEREGDDFSGEAKRKLMLIKHDFLMKFPQKQSVICNIKSDGINFYT